jgi:hypothetical protein
MGFPLAGHPRTFLRVTECTVIVFGRIAVLDQLMCWWCCCHRMELYAYLAERLQVHEGGLVVPGVCA